MFHIGGLFKVGLLSGCPDFYCDTRPQPKGCISCVVPDKKQINKKKKKSN